MDFRFGLFVAALCLGLIQMVSAAPAQTVSFQITDELSAGQVDEEIAISINHRSVGTLKIGGVKRSDTLSVTIPAAPVYHYDLCGHLHTRSFFGISADHPIDNGGDLTDLNGRALFGFNSEDKVFYLLDQTQGKTPVAVSDVTAGRSCADRVAMLQ